MSEIPRHAGLAGERSPPKRPTMPRSISSTSFYRQNSSSSTFKKHSNLAIITARIRRFQKYAQQQVQKMKWWQKILAALFLIFSLVGVILVTVYHMEILQLLLPVGKQLRDWPAGWLILWGLCYVAAFPPMIGYSTSVSLAGFVYGLPIGWLLASTGTIFGSTSAFLACRYYFRTFAQRMVATDKRFAALALTLKHDGLKLLCMIRLCPLPYSISNAAISTFPTVKPWHFIVATALSTPKLLIHVFVGTRLRMLAEEGRKMDGKTKAINYGTLLAGIIFGLGTGWIIYSRTAARARQLEHEERQRLRDSLSSSRDSIDPLVPSFTDFDQYEEVQRRDPRAAQTAALISEFLEGGDEEDEAYNDAESIHYDIDDHDLEHRLDSFDNRESEELMGVRTGSSTRNQPLPRH